MKRMLTYVAIALLAACADQAGRDDFDEFEEPALTDEEIALLPEGADDHADEEVLDGALDDLDNFQDDEVELVFDSIVIDDEEMPGVAAGPARAALLKSGLHPRASDALRALKISASRITQTVGGAPASAGTHLSDGTVNGKSYTAATDLSVRGLSTAQIKNLLEGLGKLGFAAWYRKNGADGWSGANHIHAVYANAKMKASLRSQVRSWLAGRNGLKSNTTYKFHTWSAAARNAVKAKFAASQSGTTNGGAGFAARVNTSGAPLTIRAGASTSTAAVGTVADGAAVTITCQKVGQTVSGTYGKSALWDKIGSGFVADVFVATGSDGRVAPDCP